jgi:Peptidase U49
VPTPTLDRHADKEHQAAQEIALLAAAYVLLHEIRHAMLSEDGNAPGSWQEEPMCDAFARSLMLLPSTPWTRLNLPRRF